MKIDKDVVANLLEVIDHGLAYGLGEREPGMMCVEAAVCYALGLPHGDDPGCVAGSLRTLKITLNDSGWSSPAARAKHLRRLAVAQLGSKDTLDEVLFVRKVAELATKYATEYATEYAAVYAKHATVYAKRAAGYDTACTAVCTNHAVVYAAKSAVRTALYSAKRATKPAIKFDSVLGAFCEDVVQILIEMQAPGCTYLYLTEENEE